MLVKGAPENAGSIVHDFVDVSMIDCLQGLLSEWHLSILITMKLQHFSNEFLSQFVINVDINWKKLRTCENADIPYQIINGIRMLNVWSSGLNRAEHVWCIMDAKIVFAEWYVIPQLQPLVSFGVG